MPTANFTIHWHELRPPTPKLWIVPPDLFCPVSVTVPSADYDCVLEQLKMEYGI